MNLSLLTCSVIAILVSACGDSDSATDTGPSADASTDDSTDVAEADEGSDANAQPDIVEPACIEIAAGRWDAGGECMGMPMAADLTFDADTCTFSLSNWNMAMSVPDGGSVSGATVQFEGADWDTCTGVVSDDGLSISGSCPAAGGATACEFSMEAQ